MDNLVRLKDICWLATRHDMTGMWSQTGQVVSIEPTEMWWADADDAEIADEMPAEAAAMILGEYGDRQQELVFIGVELGEAELRSVLDACLLTDAEILADWRAWSANDPA